MYIHTYYVCVYTSTHYIIFLLYMRMPSNIALGDSILLVFPLPHGTISCLRQVVVNQEEIATIDQLLATAVCADSSSGKGPGYGAGWGSSGGSSLWRTVSKSMERWGVVGWRLGLGGVKWASGIIPSLKKAIKRRRYFYFD